MIHEFRYLAPKTLPELFSLLREKGADAKILAGGTDLLVNIRSGLAKPAFVVDIKKIPGASDLAYDSRSGLSIGPAVTINRAAADPVVMKRYPLLTACARELASNQVRNRATVAGNVVNASPCADMAPPLLCLDARAVVSSARGRREVPFRDFFTGVKKTVLAPDEFLELIIVPPESAGGRGDYLKLKRINGHDLGIVGVALFRLGGTFRVAISSAAPTPVYAGEFPAGTDPEKTVRAALAAVSPISDVRCTKEYREYMIGVYVRRLLEEEA